MSGGWKGEREGPSIHPRGVGVGVGVGSARDFLPDVARGIDGIGAPRARRPRAARTQTSFALSVAATHRRGSRGRLRGPRSARSARRSAHSIGATRTPARGEDASGVAADEDVRRAGNHTAHSERSERSVRETAKRSSSLGRPKTGGFHSAPPVSDRFQTVARSVRTDRRFAVRSPIADRGAG